MSIRLHPIPGLIQLAALLCLTACEPRSITMPSPNDSGPTAGQRTVTGTLWIHGPGGLTAANSGSVFGWIQYGEIEPVRRFAPVGSNGRFQFHAAEGSVVYVTGGFHQPCAAFAEVSGDVPIDVHGVTAPDSLGANLPPMLASRGPMLLGTVYGQTANSPQPLANAAIQLVLHSGRGPWIAVTRTDSSGRYVFCNVPAVEGLAVFASHVDYSPASSAVPAGATRLDIQMSPSPVSFER